MAYVDAEPTQEPEFAATTWLANARIEIIVAKTIIAIPPCKAFFECVQISVFS